MPRDDLFSVLVRGVAERDDEVEAVREESKKVNARALIAKAKSGDELVRLIMEEGIKASVRRLDKQAALAVRQVKEEGVALKAADPTTLKPITDVDVAAHRAEKLLDVKQ